MSQVPQTPVSTPSKGPSNSRNGMATICTVVLSLPIMCTATLLEAPIWAIHSRRAEMAISRPMMIKATKTSARPRCTSTSNEAHTRNLSATVEEGAERGGLVELAGQKPIQPIGCRKDHEHHGGDEVARGGVQGRVEHPHDQGNRDDARPGHDGGDCEEHGHDCVTACAPAWGLNAA